MGWTRSKAWSTGIRSEVETFSGAALPAPWGSNSSSTGVDGASSRLVAEYSTILNPTPQVAYLTNDHLGSPRINTNELGAVVSRHDYRPYGEEVTERTHAHYVGDTVRKQFTSYERDDEIDLDFAQARYYNKNHGRFTTVDPLMASADIINPQTFNRYVYVGNNPMNITDPTGEIWGVSGDTVRWFANEAAMGAEGFTAHVAQVAWSKDGTTMYALNPGSSTPVEVQSAAEVFRHLARWGAGSAAIGATIPNFPMAALAMGESGEVKVAILVDSRGVVVSATALVGGDQLRKASVEVARSWLFSGLGRREARKCGKRNAVIVFEYILLPRDAVPNVQSLSFFLFPNKVVIRYIRPEISVDRNKDPANIVNQR
jgi:RHS repeat-associated protein